MICEVFLFSVAAQILIILCSIRGTYALDFSPSCPRIRAACIVAITSLTYSSYDPNYQTFISRPEVLAANVLSGLDMAFETDMYDLTAAAARCLLAVIAGCGSHHVPLIIQSVNHGLHYLSSRYVLSER